MGRSVLGIPTLGSYEMISKHSWCNDLFLGRSLCDLVVQVLNCAVLELVWCSTAARSGCLCTRVFLLSRSAAHGMQSLHKSRTHSNDCRVCIAAGSRRLPAGPGYAANRPQSAHKGKLVSWPLVTQAYGISLEPLSAALRFCAAPFVMCCTMLRGGW